MFSFLDSISDHRPFGNTAGRRLGASAGCGIQRFGKIAARTIGRQKTLASALLVGAVLSFVGPQAALAEVSHCDSTISSTGGQDASVDLLANEVFLKADSPPFVQRTSQATIGREFVAESSLPAEIRNAVTFGGVLTGSLGINTNLGELTVTVKLLDVTDNVEIGSQQVVHEFEDGAFAATVFKVIAHNPFDPPTAIFEDVLLKAGHTYRVTMHANARAKGGLGEADLKDEGSVGFGCTIVSVDDTDSDGDGLYDHWEQNGIDVDWDGVVDVDLPAMGANWEHKDLFVELDWRPGQEPSRDAIQAVKDAFALAPIDAGGVANPDGLPGINLWVDTGGLMEDGFLVGDDFGGGNEIQDPVICLDESFYDAKAVHFDPNRLLAFRYAVSGISPGENTCDNGLAVGGLGEIGGNDFIVYDPSAATFMHELGHTLDLRHGGFEDLNNKPNYVSIMNYNYGFNIPQAGGGGILDFSPPRCAGCPGGRGAIPDTLNETQLDETKELDENDLENMFVFRDLAALNNTYPMAGLDIDNNGTFDVDWDGDSLISFASVTVDINEDGKCVDPGPDGIMQSIPVGDDVLLSDNLIHDGMNRVCQTTADPQSDDIQTDAVNAGQPNLLQGHDDWSAVVLPPLAHGEDGAKALNLPTEPERTFEEGLDTAIDLNITDLAIYKSVQAPVVNADEEFTYSLMYTNSGPQPARGIRIVDTLPSEATFVSASDPSCAENPVDVITCEPDTLYAGQSGVIDITVIVSSQEVLNLPAPVQVVNTALIENRIQLGVTDVLGDIAIDLRPSDNASTVVTTINRPPVADPAGPYLDRCSLRSSSIDLDGSGSYDPDGDPLTYEWTTDCQNSQITDPSAEITTLTVIHPDPCSMVCTVSLTVKDPMGLDDSESTSVTIVDPSL